MGSRERAERKDTCVLTPVQMRGSEGGGGGEDGKVAEVEEVGVSGWLELLSLI